MRFLPILLVLIGLVMLMAGSARKGRELGQSMGIVIVGLIILAAIFAVFARRAGL